jgi:hypothetical protein
MKPSKLSSDWKAKQARGEWVDLARLARYRALKKGFRAVALGWGWGSRKDCWLLLDPRTGAVLLGAAATVEEILEFIDRDKPVPSRLS